MSAKELEECINKIEPNFNSHLEKGTIEMSNEYYNLLEEKMVRLINKNQELKEENKRLYNTIEELSQYQYDREEEDMMNYIIEQEEVFNDYSFMEE